MRKRTGTFALAIFTLLVAATMLTPRLSHAESATSAADQCIAKPDGAPPEGQHWYYQTDRATKRKCRYLADKSLRSRVRQDTAAKRVSPPKPEAAPAESPPATPDASKAASSPPAPAAPAAAEAVQAESGPAEPPSAPAMPMQGSAGQTTTDQTTSAFSNRWPALTSRGDIVNDQPAPSASNEAAGGSSIAVKNEKNSDESVAYADEPSSADSSANSADSSANSSADEMPLVWPVLTAEERAAAAESAPSSSIGIGSVLTLLLCALAFAAATPVVFNAIRRKRSAGNQAQWANPRETARVPSAAPRSAGRPAAPGYAVPQFLRRDADMYRKPATPASRRPTAPREPSPVRPALREDMPRRPMRYAP